MEQLYRAIGDQGARIESLERTVAGMDKKLDEVLENAAEKRGERRGQIQLAGAAWTLVKALVPTGIFAGAAHWAGLLKLPIAILALLVIAPAPARAEPASPDPVRYCADVQGERVAPLPAWREGAGYERQALFLPCVELAHEDDA